jgi:hypothetical protein
MRRIRTVLYAAGLVGSPLLFGAYWLLYPAYGDLAAADIVADSGAAPGRTEIADACAFAAVFLAVPGALGYLRALVERSPRLARTGCALAVLGWMAVLPLLVLDVVARELAATPALFIATYHSTAVVVLSAVAALHVVGGVVIGVALVRTRLVPRSLGVAAALAPLVHLASNLAGLLWVDVLCWLVAAVTGMVVVPGLARLVAADEAVLRGDESAGPGDQVVVDRAVV